MDPGLHKDVPVGENASGEEVDLLSRAGLAMRMATKRVPE